MPRLPVALAFAAALLAAPAFAETDWTIYGSFATTRCEDPATIADIKEAAKGLRFDETGTPVMSAITGLRIISAKTIRATPDTLLCDLYLEFTTAGRTLTQHGEYTVQIYPDGTWRTHFEPDE